MIDELTKINNTIEDSFSNIGFKRNKKGDSYKKKENEYTDIFNIILSKNRNNSFNLHLTLEKVNTEVENLYKRTIKEVTNFLKRPDKSKGVKPVCILTDWKDLYNSQTMPIDDIWFTSFNNIEEIDNWQGKLKKAVGLAIYWFNECKDIEKIKQYCLMSGLTYNFEIYLILVKLFDNNNLENHYKELIDLKKDKFGWDKKEVEIFHKILKEN